ncbi:hypothetical protein EV175_002164 [Coemansia sp. RSA 1933]|nr:hypothetical protein EV175_002164 [Coemansia sp. RSA 1933]
MSTTVSRPESVTGYSPSRKQVHAPVATKPNKNHEPPPLQQQQQQQRKPRNAHKTSNQEPQHRLRNSASRGKLNNSDQRNQLSENDESGSQQPGEGSLTPTKGGRHRGSRGGRGKQKQQDMSAKAPPSVDNSSRTSKPAKQRNRRRQPPSSYLDNNGDDDNDVVLLPSSSPGAVSNPQQRTPDRRMSKPRQQQQQQRPASTPGGAFEPPTRMNNGNEALTSSTVSMPVFGSPSRVRSPISGSRSNHYAGASFNNSPAPSSLPMPPSFLASPTKASTKTSITRDEDVFGPPGAAATIPEHRLAGNSGHQHHPSLGLPPPPPAFAHNYAAAPSYGNGSVNAALSERSRQLESMLASNGGTVVYQQMPSAALAVAGMHNSHSSVDLTHMGGDMASVVQKLRHVRELASNRPATVSPIASTNQTNQLASVYNA